MYREHNVDTSFCQIDCHAPVDSEIADDKSHCSKINVSVMAKRLLLALLRENTM